MTDDEVPTPDAGWDIRREGRAWTGEEWAARRERVPRKIELIEGMLFRSDEDRLNMLALLLENVGVDRAVRLGDARAWREAIAEMPGEEGPDAPEGA